MTISKLAEFFQTAEGFLSIRRLGFFLLLISGLVGKEILFFYGLSHAIPNFAELDGSCNKTLDYSMAALGFAAIDPVINLFRKPK